PASAAEFDAHCRAYLDRATRLQAQLEGGVGKPTFARTYRTYDALRMVLASIEGDAGVVSQTNLTPAVRDAARSCAEKIDGKSTELSLSKPIYVRLKGIDTAGLDEASRHVLGRTISQYERAGVGADAATGAKIKALQDRISKNSIAFERNIAEGVKTVSATRAELDGLPADYIASRKPQADGTFVLTTNTPDLGPVMSYAASADLRRRLYFANLTRAYPANNDLLRSILADRDELARLLGRPNFATLALEDKMIGSPANAQRFLTDMDAVAAGPGMRDYNLMLERLKKIDPAATSIPAWSTTYLGQLVRKEQLSVDPQEVRQYFAYNNVRDGILRLTEDLFGVEIRPWKTKLWAPGVEAYEMYQGDVLLGRFYLDNHPRDGKYTHANVIPIRSGLAGRSIPVGILVCNFPAGDHSTGLMEHRDVETFLHEFGHLLHVIFAGRQDTQAAQILGMEWDFIEAPSQMLENWVWDYDTLKRFAVNAKGEPIPEALVARMNKARGFGEAYGDRRQFGLSQISLDYHLKTPGDADLTAIYKAAVDRYGPIPLPDGVHPQASFGHLTGYSAFYYTYMWSKAVSSDLFTAFQQAGIRDRATAQRYRERVLAPGASKPAAALISDFLGRPLRLDAYRARISAAP
ncbi:MAG: Zn-dependent oligopeptidase, partial [Alphaproteobacteria bacterium]|nr:Zn-dependent oligopeptidase [Alphaproteobacteria bacterium]